MKFWYLLLKQADELDASFDKNYPELRKKISKDIDEDFTQGSKKDDQFLVKGMPWDKLTLEEISQRSFWIGVHYAMKLNKENKK
ncbi:MULTISPECIES: hypothetical protein [unclassified Microcoleus]|uniref:hypothetical protein n=1 Tax=unclassified Microcoleus TaxID=2642155 RepID=UPI002FD38BA9